MKLLIFVGLTVFGLFGAWIGSTLDHGNMFGVWGLILGTLGSLFGVWAGFKAGQLLEL